MKLLIISDAHSNICALDAVLSAEADADAIYCAGDLTDYGPFPHEVIARFKQYNIKTVMGNHDRNLLRVWEEMKIREEALSQEEFRWVHHNCERMDEGDIDYLRTLPDTLDFVADGYHYRISHQYDRGYGRPQSIFDFDNFIGEKPTDARDLPTRLILGHSHRQAICHFRDNRLFLNPGSVSYRRLDDPDKTAHYALITGGEIVLKALSYDHTPLWDELRRLKEEKRMSEKEQEYGAFFFGLPSDESCL